MTMSEQLRWWGVGLVVLLFLLWLLSDALLPFILGAAIAYFTDPVADRLERIGLGRMMATVVITLLAIGIGVVTLVVVIPLLVEQIRSFIQNAPEFYRQASELMRLWFPKFGEPGSLLDNASQSLRGQLNEWSISVLQKVWSGGLAVIDFVMLLFITPVVAFYLLNDWDNIIARIDDVLPRQHQGMIHHLAKELDDVLAGFIRGQLTVCLVLGSFYAISLTLVGLSFGLLVGFFAGLISFIPFVGSIVGGAISIGIAVVQFWNQPYMIAVVAVIFVVGQAVEGNYLTPNLVGGHVKLHPVWLIFALSAFGSLMGFVGMLIAVPAAAVIGVLLRFLVGQYKSGRLYHDETDHVVHPQLDIRGGSPGENTEKTTPGDEE